MLDMTLTNYPNHIDWVYFKLRARDFTCINLSFLSEFICVLWRKRGVVVKVVRYYHKYNDLSLIPTPLSFPSIEWLTGSVTNLLLCIVNKYMVTSFERVYLNATLLSELNVFFPSWATGRLIIMLLNVLYILKTLSGLYCSICLLA